MDAHVAIPKPDNITLAQASTAGVAIFTAALGIFDSLRIPLPDPASLPGPRNEWALVFGGAGSVGQLAVQLFKVCGFKVIVTCSQKSFGVCYSSVQNGVPAPTYRWDFYSNYRIHVHKPNRLTYLPKASQISWRRRND
jgi:hypothetical protein